MNITGSLNTFALTGLKRKIPIPEGKVRELASLGLSKRAIAKQLGMCYTSFRGRLVDELAIYREWEAGAKIAGTFTDKQRPKTILDADEGLIYLQKVDEKVILPALERKQFNGRPLESRKRIRVMRELTGLDDYTIIAALERLVSHGMALQHNGLMFTEFEACSKKNEHKGDTHDEQFRI